MRSNAPGRFAMISLAVAAFAMAFASGCGDSDDDSTPTSSATVVSTRPASTPAAAPSESVTATESTPTSTIEVQGVVGAVDVQTRTIDIKPTGEAKYTRIVLGPTTMIKRAGGGSIPLKDLRPSDRIIAFGRPGDDPTTLLSTDVTIQQVLPGAQPGG